jgi:hypothetical protein
VVIEVDRSAWPAHQAHGDFQVASGATVATCLQHGGQGSTATVTRVPSSTATLPSVPSVTTTSQAQNNDRITICHATSSSTNPWVVIEIDRSAWPAHQAHGDFMVAAGSAVSICLQMAGQQPTVTPPAAPSVTVTLTALPSLTATLPSAPSMTATLPTVPSVTATAAEMTATAPVMSATPSVTVSGQVMVCQPNGNGGFTAISINAADLAAFQAQGAILVGDPSLCAQLPISRPPSRPCPPLLAPYRLPSHR